jgi:sulfur transfer complex TusBCD TusB component (DsrH family)
VLRNIQQKDYVIATSVERLMQRFNPVDAGRVLHEAAQFSLARNGVVACLESYDSKKIEKLIDTDWNGRLNPLGWGHGWKYLLFIGELDIVPSWEMTFKNNYIVYTDTRKARVADNAYADVKEGDTYIPELALGRLPGNSPDDFIQQMKNALSNIESNKAVLLSGTGDGTGEFVKNINAVNKLLYPYSSKVVRHWKDFSDDSSRLNTFRQDVPDADLIFYRGHGWYTSWDGNTVTDDHLRNRVVSFTLKHPIVWSIACLTGDIRKNSLAEAFLRAGASAFIGSTDLSARGYNNQFAKDLALYHNRDWLGVRSIGEAFRYAKLRLVKYYSGFSFTTIRLKQLVNEYNLYGDPKRGRTPDSSEETMVLLSTEANAQYGKPPKTIEILIPKFEVEAEDGIDYVSIPNPEGETTYLEHNEPIVPSYIN